MTYKVFCKKGHECIRESCKAGEGWFCPICDIDADEMSSAMGISEMEHEQDEVTPYGTKDEYGGL